MKKYLLLLLGITALAQNPQPFPNGARLSNIVGYPNTEVSVNSTTGGFLIPRMTTTQKNAIVTPVLFSQLIDTDLGKHQYYNGTTWVDSFGGSQNLRQTLENGNDATLDIKFPFDEGLGISFDDSERRYGFFIYDRPIMENINKLTGIYKRFNLFDPYFLIETNLDPSSPTDNFYGLKGQEEYIENIKSIEDEPDRRLFYAQVGYVDDAIASSGGGGAVDSVNGQTGTVVLDADDISDSGTTNKWTNAAEKSTWNAKGNGTVTTVSVVTANGVTGSIANATTTPAITLSLGAITPTTVVASGNVTAPNIDATNKTDIAARELLSNKSDNDALGSSTSLYPTQRAAKVYSDNLFAGAWQGLGNSAVNNNMVLGTASGSNFNWSIIRNGAVMLAFNNNAIGVGGSVVFTGGNVANNGQLGIGSTTTALSYSRNLTGAVDLSTYTDLNSAATGRLGVWRSNIGGTTADRVAILKTGQVEIADATATNQAMTLGQLGAVNNTTTALTKAALNAAYPNVNVGFIVQAKDITTGAMIYIKNSEAGSSDVWLSLNATITP